MVCKERLDNRLGKRQLWTSADGAPGGALGRRCRESVRVELGGALEKQNKKVHFNVAGT